MLNSKLPKESGRIYLTKKECYCGIVDFYQIIAAKMGYNSDEITFDCRKISVTNAVMDQIFAYYTEECQMSEGDIAQGRVDFGPKADILEDGYMAVIHKGFIMEVNS